LAEGAKEAKEAKAEMEKQKAALKKPSVDDKPKNETPWNNVKNTDDFRDMANKVVMKHLNDREDRVNAIQSDIDAATAATAAKVLNNNILREGAQQNSWHEYWSLKPKVWETPEHDSHHWADTTKAVQFKI
jgi:hypothetical protein